MRHIRPALLLMLSLGVSFPAAVRAQGGHFVLDPALVSAEQATEVARRKCGIPNGFFSARKTDDNHVRLSESPSLTQDQKACIRGQVEQMGLVIQDH